MSAAVLHRLHSRMLYSIDLFISFCISIVWIHFKSLFFYKRTKIEPAISRRLLRSHILGGSKSDRWEWEIPRLETVKVMSSPVGSAANGHLIANTIKSFNQCDCLRRANAMSVCTQHAAEVILDREIIVGNMAIFSRLSIWLPFEAFVKFPTILARVR